MEESSCNHSVNKIVHTLCQKWWNSAQWTSIKINRAIRDYYSKIFNTYYLSQIANACDIFNRTCVSSIYNSFKKSRIKSKTAIIVIIGNDHTIYLLLTTSLHTNERYSRSPLQSLHTATNIYWPIQAVKNWPKLICYTTETCASKNRE